MRKQGIGKFAKKNITLIVWLVKPYRTLSNYHKT